MSQVLSPQTQDEACSADFYLSYETYEMEQAAKRLSDEIERCDNSITLMESAIALDNALETIAAARKQLDTRLYRLQYPSLFEAA